MKKRPQIGVSKLLILATLSIVSIARVAWGEEAPLQIAGATTVNAEQVIALINSTPGLVVVDSRKPEDFATGAIEGAVLLTDVEMTPETLARVVQQKSTPVLFYCNGLKCGRAAKAVTKAVDWGYSRVYYYALGIAEWHKLHLPLVIGEKAAQ